MKNSDRGGPAKVFYVLKSNAKQAKTILEHRKLLDKRFRLTQVDPYSSFAVAMLQRDAQIDDYMVLPYIDESPAGSLETDSQWKQLVVGEGVQWCCFSSTILGNRALKSGVPVSSTSQTPIEQTLMELIRTFQDIETPGLDNLLQSRVASLSQRVCPKSLEVIGDDRTLVIPPHAFDMDDLNFQSLVPKDRGHEFFDAFWAQLAKIHGSPRIVRRGGIDPDSSIRQSGTVLVWPVVGVPDATGPGSPGWITVTENGIRQSFDLTRVMFSRGNITEKIRFGQLVQPGEVVLDMYAGIGYYTLPALIHGHASQVYACEWNEFAIQALLYNLEENGVGDDRAVVLQGDCRTLANDHNLVNKFDRVSLGLLPSSEGGWRTAVQALRTSIGGWLHVHGNVPEKELQIWTLWLCSSLFALCREYRCDVKDEYIVVCTHVEKVKSFAPTVSHYVADVFCGPRYRYPAFDLMKHHRAGVLQSNGSFLPCSNQVQVPSCALSPDGPLHQHWLMDL